MLVLPVLVVVVFAVSVAAALCNIDDHNASFNVVKNYTEINQIKTNKSGV